MGKKKKNKKFICDSCSSLVSVKELSKCFYCFSRVCEDCLFFCPGCGNYFCEECFNVVGYRCHFCFVREEEQKEVEKAKKEGKFELLCQSCQNRLIDYDCFRCNFPICSECCYICDECDEIICENCSIVITYIKEDKELKSKIEENYYYCKDCYFKSEEWKGGWLKGAIWGIR